MDRNDLAVFLRTMRERLLPQDVGLPAGPSRRTPGLRREEVAREHGSPSHEALRLLAVVGTQDMTVTMAEK